MNNKEYKIIAHSLGVETSKKRLPKEFYQNRFIAGESHSDIEILDALKKRGWADCTPPQDILGGSCYWWVTELGIKKFREIHMQKNCPHDPFDRNIDDNENQYCTNCGKITKTAEELYGEF